MKQNAGKVFDLLEYFSALLDKPYKEISSNIKVNFSDLNHNSTTISEENISATFLHKACENFELPEQSQFFDRLLKCLYFQLITDILSQRVQQDHIITCINLFSSIKPELEKVIKLNEISEDTTNVTIINLKCVSDQNIKKIIPLLVCKKLYEEQKSKKPEDRQSLTFIIDEAHNILSNESFREAESWRDYRLETFEEIIKEGRKFGVFVTISSQRPSDISETITSQAHNYFIHRLINQKDLVMISKAVSYIDKITESSIPVLPTGTCIFSGIATQLPLKLKIDRLSDECQPHSDTFKYTLVTD
jgi:DNA helicase HerA-like ATPase